MYHGILTAAKNNYEDKKLELIGRFYGNIIFIDWLEPYFFHILLSTLNNLNYKQLCILAVIGLHEDFEKQLKSLEDLQGRDNWYETRLIQNELSNMIATGLLEPHNTALMTYVGHRHLNNCRLGLVGELLFKICELDVIDKEDLEDIVNKFI
ncbi:hypothetical protein SAMN05421739_1167 [Pontibacter chinhatensis]|uniref:Uncharacterized protein n=2 Tax=Pontibacter chinhatensis TaxID=1436961 RepID=A0A1I2ZM99_9BACT|nr:hypothetical protein SAMN05421739_1167 [Pontibacter chinhatensis]